MSETASLPRDSLIRALHPGYEVRDAEDGTPTLFGHFAVFNRWTEINSWFEGRFLERILPGAFKKTMRENRDRIRVLLNHGQDPEVGDKPIGAINELREDTEGAAYEVGLFPSVPPLVVDGLRAGQYGASFRFEVMREEIVEQPDPSDDNPQALPERSIKEVRLHEFGPVTFPAYADATAGLRSLTDRFLFEQIERHPERLREIVLARAIDLTALHNPAPSTPDAADTSAPRDQERRETWPKVTEKEWEELWNHRT